jgi:hypothetical protein
MRTRRRLTVVLEPLGDIDCVNVCRLLEFRVDDELVGHQAWENEDSGQRS